VISSRRIRRAAAAPVLTSLLLIAHPPLSASQAQPGSRAESFELDPSSTLHAKPPRGEGTVVLFDGTKWTGWHQHDGAPSEWPVQDDGSVIVQHGNAITDESFGSFHLHLEFLCPHVHDARDQGRANSGVYLHGRYEVQVLDSFGDEPLINGCGAVYSIAPPRVNASRPAGEWQTYDIIFRAPAPGNETESDHAFVTILHNGIVIHNNLELPQTTPGGLDQGARERGPIMLQDHGNPVRYRNIWAQRLD